IVSPGTYSAVDLQAGQLKGPITLLADLDGSLTGSTAGSVTISGTERSAAMTLAGQQDLTVDGFTLKGGTNAALLVVNSSGLVILDCTMTRSSGDGIHFENSDTSLIFNNLVYGNAGTGIRLVGTDVMEVVSNTVYGSRNDGVFVGPGDLASGSVFMENNIFNK